MKKEYKYRTYRLSIDSLDIVKKLSEEFTQRMGNKVSLNSTLNSLIAYCKDVTFADIANKNKEDKK